MQLIGGPSKPEERGTSPLHPHHPPLPEKKNTTLRKRSEERPHSRAFFLRDADLVRVRVAVLVAVFVAVAVRVRVCVMRARMGWRRVREQSEICENKWVEKSVEKAKTRAHRSG